MSEDFLGVYEYDASGLFADEQAVNRATIRLYWGVIGLVSEWLGCVVEDLAIVVLTHELAHAYTQLGADIEGRRWAAPSFAAAESALMAEFQAVTAAFELAIEHHHAGTFSVDGVEYFAGFEGNRVRGRGLARGLAEIGRTATRRI